jgi:RNA polymerase sigma-70 factor (ECF subfamily)
MINLSPYEEQTLICQLKAGDKQAFNQLFYQHERKLYNFSCKLLHSQEDAEEIVQEVFIRVWEHRSTLKEGLPFEAFIIRIAKNLIYNKAKRRVNEHAYKEYCIKHLSTPLLTTENEVNFNALKELTSHFIEQLPPKRKIIFTMSRVRGLTNQEIADQLNVSTSTVENQINIALKALKHHIYQHDVDMLGLLFAFLFL